MATGTTSILGSADNPFTHPKMTMQYNDDHFAAKTEVYCMKFKYIA